MRRLLALSLLSLFALAPLVGADTIYLKNGGRFEGKVLEEDAKEVVFKIRGVGPQTFRRADVLKIEKGVTVFDVYEEKRASVPEGDAEAWCALGRWCYEEGLRQEGRRAFGEAIKADTDHVGSRKALGYSNVRGKWLNRRQLRKYREKKRKELERVVGGLVLGPMVSDKEASVKFRPPKGWTRTDAAGGLATEFLGPELHGVRLLVGYETACPLDPENFQKDVLEELKGAHDDLRPVKEDAPASLGGKVVRELVCRFGSGESETERHDIFMKRPDDVLHVWYCCPAGDVDALKGLFSEVCGSFKDYEERVGSRPFAYKLPDDDWAKGIDEFEGPDLRGLGDVAEVIHHIHTGTFIFMSRQRVEGVSAAPLETIQRSAMDLLGKSLSGFKHEKDQRRKVGGQPALVCRFRGTDRDGTYIEGWLCVLKKGNHFYLILGGSDGSMNSRAFEKDFGKLLDSFKV